MWQGRYPTTIALQPQTQRSHEIGCVYEAGFSVLFRASFDIQLLLLALYLEAIGRSPMYRADNSGVRMTDSTRIELKDFLQQSKRLEVHILLNIFRAVLA